MNNNIYIAISIDRKDKIVFQANNINHARHLVINSLDLSKEWFIYTYYEVRLWHSG